MHLIQFIVLFILSNKDVKFVLKQIYLYQIELHRQLYVNVCLIQSHEQKLCWNHIYDCCAIMNSMSLFFLCHHAYEHFEKTCTNCKWSDYNLCCFLQNVADRNIMYNNNSSEERLYKENQLSVLESASNIVECSLLLNIFSEEI